MTPQDAEYDRVRTNFASASVPPAQPRSIFLPHTTEETAGILRNFKRPGDLVGVRSGGHLFSCPALIDGGILVDTSYLNRNVQYNEDDQTLHFGPAVQVRELSEALCKVDRFFPHGHAPSVAAGGFCLAGGQGMFMHGWGGTVETWILSMEIVTAAGDIVHASRSENSDLFWAARGGGQGFFGVVTRIVARTVPAKRSMYETVLSFRIDDAFQDLIKFAITHHDAMPDQWTEAAICTFYSEKFNNPGGGDRDFVKGNLMLSVVAGAYAESLDEAQAMLGVWEQVPDMLKANLVSVTAVRSITWKEFFDNQDILSPCHTGKDYWAINSILTDPGIDMQDVSLDRPFVPHQDTG